MKRADSRSGWSAIAVNLVSKAVQQPTIEPRSREPEKKNNLQGRGFEPASRRGVGVEGPTHCATRVKFQNSLKNTQAKLTAAAANDCMSTLSDDIENESIVLKFDFRIQNSNRILNYFVRTIATASFSALSPKTSAKRSGSTCISVKTDRTVTENY